MAGEDSAVDAGVMQACVSSLSAPQAINVSHVVLVPGYRRWTDGS